MYREAASLPVAPLPFPGPGWASHSLSRVDQLLSDVVEEVPAAEGKGALEEGQSQVTHGGCHPEVKGIAGPQLLEVSWGSRGQGSVLPSQPCARPHPGPTLEDLDKAHANDEGQGQQLPASEDVLDACGPAHAGAVHPRQEHWGGKESGRGATAKPTPGCWRAAFPPAPSHSWSASSPPPETELTGGRQLEGPPTHSVLPHRGDEQGAGPRWALTQAGHGECAGGSGWGDAVGEHGLQHVVREGHGDDRQAGWVHDEDRTPEQQEAGTREGPTGTVPRALQAKPAQVWERGCSLGCGTRGWPGSSGRQEGRAGAVGVSALIWTFATEMAFGMVKQLQAALGQVSKRTGDPATFLTAI